MAFEASEVQDMLETFCSAAIGSTSEALVITGTTLNGVTIFSVPLPELPIAGIYAGIFIFFRGDVFFNSI